jgi:hypothetical protein
MAGGSFVMAEEVAVPQIAVGVTALLGAALQSTARVLPSTVDVAPVSG